MNDRRSFYRCSYCRPKLNWPLDPLYTRCPKCDTPMAMMVGRHGLEIMSLDAAQSLVNHLTYEGYCALEDEARAARALRDRRELFADIIHNAGYSSEERERIADLEAQLPSAHKENDNGI
jgi:hypothetical protein